MNTPKNGVTNGQHVVVLIHGIRTFGAWQDRLAQKLKEQEPDIEVVRYRYGYFSALAFLIPFLRIFELRRFARFLESQSADWKDARVDIVAHSFGTYVTGWALRQLDPAVLHLHTIVLCGSVLKQYFPWDSLIGKDKPVQRVINDCGEQDIWPVLAQMFVLGMGLAGRHGFTGATGPDIGLTNRFFPVDHSGFFDEEFMQQHWLPILTTEQAPAEYLVPPTPRWHAALEHYAEPFKLLLLLSPFIVAFAIWQSQNVRIARAETESQRQVFENFRLTTQRNEQARLRKEEENRRKRAEAFQSVADANRELFLDPPRSLLYSARAHRMDPLDEAIESQREAFQVMQLRRKIQQADAAQWYQGYSWFNPSFFRGRLSARTTRDGKLVVLAIDRISEQEQRGLGTAYLLNNASLKVTKLERSAGHEYSHPLDYVGFGSSRSSKTARVYVSRRIYIEIYSTEGTFLNTIEVSPTKLPLSIVDDVADGSIIIAGDTAGNAWPIYVDDDANLEPDGPIGSNLVYANRMEKGTNPVIRFIPSPSGKLALMIQLLKDAPALGERGDAERLRALVWRVGQDGTKSCTELEQPGSILYAAFSPQSNQSGVEQFVTATSEGVVQFWELPQGKSQPEEGRALSHEQPVGFVAYADQADQLLTVTDDGTARVWDAQSGELLNQIDIHR